MVIKGNGVNDKASAAGIRRLQERKLVTAPKPAPFTSRFIEANGLKLHYLDYGTEGPRRCSACTAVR